MKDNEYKVKRVFIELAGFNALIMVVPKTDLNDKLSFLARESGLIKKSFYDDFLISHFMANINDFLTHLSQKNIQLPELVKIRQEVVTKVIEANPELDPDKLIVNKNHIVKVRESEDEDGSPLSKNDLWPQDVYKESEKQFLDHQNANPLSSDRTSNPRSPKQLAYLPQRKYWKRLNQYIIVKQFNEEEAKDIILNNHSFNTKTAFQQYIVTICIEEVENLFVRLDKLGLPTKVAPPTLISELYTLCKEVNPFLDYNEYRSNGSPRGDEDDEEYDEDFDPFAGVAHAAHAPMKKTRKKKGKTFKQITKTHLLGLPGMIKDRVVGQDKAVDSLSDAIQRASVGLKDPDQPVGSFIFAGHSGVGKTYAAKVLAEKLIGSKRSLITIDCSEYTADHEYAKLIGAPFGYIGHDQGGYLTNAIVERPFSVVLFDEVEKANEKVHQLLLQVMDEGRLTDGRGQPVSFKDAIIVMTSNLGVKEMEDVMKTIGFGEESDLTDEKREKSINKALKKKFKPEFINRLTDVIQFSDLVKSDYLRIIELELEKLKEHLKENDTEYSNINLKFNKSVINFIYKDGIDPHLGARPLKRIIEREISTPLAKALIQQNVSDEDKITVSVVKNKLQIKVVKGKKKESSDTKSVTDKPPFYMTKEKSSGASK